jgi:hypothetical protein
LKNNDKAKFIQNLIYFGEVLLFLKKFRKMKPLPLPFISKLALAIISIIGIGYLIKLGESILAPFFLPFY